MFNFLKRKMGITKSNVQSGGLSERRRVRLGVESLESREVLSGFEGLPVVQPTNFQASNTPVQTPTPVTNNGNVSQSSISLNQSGGNAIANEILVVENTIARFILAYETFIYDLTHQVPNLQGVNFTMTSQRNGGSNYTLQIQQQTDQLFGTATFTGLWGGHAAVTGTLSVELDGSIAIQASWTEGSNSHSLQGFITGQPGSYHIEADVTVNGSSSTGPGHLSGNQS